MRINRYFLKGLVFLVSSIVLSLSVFSQDTTLVKFNQVKEKYISSVNRTEEKYTAAVQSKLKTFDNQVDGYTSRTLDKLISQEKKMKAKVTKVDPAKANQLFNYAIDSLRKFQTTITSKVHRLSRFFPGNYFSYLDTMKQSLSFYKKGQDALNAAKGMQGRLDSSLNSVTQAEARLATVDQLNTFLQQRSAVLQTQLNSFPGLASGLNNVNKEIYYYQAQVSQYKQTLQDPQKIEQVVLNALRQSAGFQQFMSQNSELSSLLHAPAGALPSLASTPVNGLPSGTALRQFMQKKFPGSDIDAIDKIRAQAADATSKTPSSDAGGLLKSQLSRLQGNGNATPPDFTPNGQHGLPFGRRLEFGFNMQFGSSTQYLPSKVDFGLLAGYKFNDKFSLGGGIAYTMGMGTGLNHIQLSNQSVGLRTYLKWKMKSNFYLQGGEEWNYLTSFTSLSQLKNNGGWQTSALAGAGREFKVSKKLNGNLQVLYDFLWNRHFPPSQPVVFRIGYNF